MVIKKVLRHGCETYLAVMVETFDDNTLKVFKIVNMLLDKFVNVTPPKLPKTLPSRWVIDYKIKLIQGLTPLACTLYKILPLELGELTK